MMNKIIAFLLIAFSTISVKAKDLDAYVIYTSDGKKVDFFKMMKELEDKKFVFFGELHNNPISHWLQFEVTKKLYNKHKSRLVLGAEMFEADNQYIIDEYLQGKISASSFQDEVRLWPNYDTDYKPLMEFAKAQGLYFVATNVPRRYASMAYKQGIDSLKTLSNTALQYIAPLDNFKFDSTVNCYRKMIHEFGSHGGVNIATAQALKDATMAHFILKNYSNRNVFLHFNGAYHSDFHEGIIHYLKKEVNEDKIITISTVSQESTDELEKAYYESADFIICVPETMTTTH
ncbi:ChaN family lipoprotein [Paracrocinitomix mangrovi]|uniref:ChaN family lipoprotein n=1 Tax=Paracrocinitomix mangrovi TaxID=2862509 RepID=UPI001EDA8F11|nr:ChaN family lipoprotein [Paracrocinitomix mangrovi]UKN01457.1 ChaN family lipoprotein [Paracrocinitomix mangrovi]